MGFYASTRDGEPDPDTELDLTNSHFEDLEGLDVRSTLQYVDLTANRLRRIDTRLLNLQDLKFLCLRQNLLTSGDELGSAAFKGTLEELYITDNKLTAIPDLNGFNKLKRLEFSYNEIRDLQPLGSVSGDSLVDVYVAANKVTRIESLARLTNLTALELGHNRVKGIENLETLVQLDQLWLGRNRISAISGLSTLTRLRQLSLQANRLESMKGVGVLGGLEELYLSQNGITAMEDLGGLSRLTVLDLASNRIAKVEGLEQQTRLTDLWLNDNLISDLNHIECAVASCKTTLRVVYLADTPASKSTDAYLLVMKQMLPSLEYLDHVRIAR